MKKLVVLTYLIIILLITCACWDYMDLDRMTIVSGVGIDMNANGEVIVTFQLLKPVSSSNQGEATEDEKVLVLEEKADTIFDAIRNASMHSSRKLYFAHTQVAILGKEAAKINPEGLLKIFSRDAEIRTLEYVLVAENTASEILKGKGALDSIQSQDLGSLVGNYKASGKVVPIKVTDISAAMLSKTTSPVAPIVRLDDEDRSYLSGTAVLRENHYVGELNDDETRGFLWITGQLESGLITVEDKQRNLLVAFEILSTQSSIKAKFEEKLIIEISVKAITNLGNDMKSTKKVSIDELIKMQEDVVKSKINMALKKASYYKADIFGLGDYLHGNHPNQWKTMENNWSNIFSKLEYQVDVDIKTKSQGLLKAEFKEE